MAKKNKRLLARLNEVGEPGSKGFSLTLQGASLDGLVVQKDGQVFAYLNSCPHTGAPLDWMPDQFLDLDGAYIQCAVHGALFEIDSGLCVHGPCTEQHLQSLPVVVENGAVYLSPE